MLDHHRPASITPFKWRFTGGPIMAHFEVVFGFSLPSATKTVARVGPLLTTPFLDARRYPQHIQKWLVWNKCMLGKRPLAPPPPHPTLWIRACLKQSIMDRLLEPYEPTHDIIYEPGRRSLTRAFATHGWRQRLRTEFQTSSHAEFVRISIKRFVYARY